MSGTAGREVIRIGNCSGFYGDRLSAMREMLEGGELDYLTGDYLAELTMLILGKDRMANPSGGYAKTFVKQLGDCLGLARERGVRIVANAGGLNPAGCAAAIRELAAAQGLEVSVAHVEGDDLMARAGELGLAAAGGGGRGPVVTANAYLGAFGIAEALRLGADVVVTGRVTDASVVVGPAIAEFGWGREDFDALAGAVVVGHVLECGAQATGGNFSGWRSVGGFDGAARLGFPLAELHRDGTAVITKHPGTGGAVTVDTVTAQLVYEVQGEPYLGPDVVTHLDSISLSSEGPDRVRISGVVGSAPPPTVKVGLNVLSGHRNSMEFVLTGLDIEEKAALVQAQLTAALKESGKEPEVVEWRLVDTSRPDPATQEEATALLRCHVKSVDPDKVGRAFSGAVVELALASYPGFTLTSPPGNGSPYGVFKAAYVDQSEVPHVVVLADGTRIDIPPPPLTQSKEQSVTPGPLQGDLARETASRIALSIDGDASRIALSIELGRVVYARSGDKGGDANVGLWVPSTHPRRAAAYAWLRDLVTVDEVRRLVPEAAELDIEVHALPNLAAVNVVIHGLLGEGVAASTRFDPQAKALGEWIRARHIEVPEELVHE